MFLDNKSIREQYEKEVGRPFKREHLTDEGADIYDLFGVFVGVAALVVVIVYLAV